MTSNAHSAPSMPLICGHRFCRGFTNPPENTIAALREAIWQGAEALEFDVRTTADLRLVVFHDKTLERLTGSKGKVKEFTLAELREFGIRDPEHPTRLHAIPTLDEVMAEAHLHQGRIRFLNCELKGKRGAREFARALERYLQQGWNAENFRVCSFKPERLLDMKFRFPEIKRGLLVMKSDPQEFLSEQYYLRKILVAAEKVGAYSINLPIWEIRSAVAQALKGEGYQLLAWTKDEMRADQSPKAMRNLQRALDEGVEAIITDYPNITRKVCRELLGTRQLSPELISHPALLPSD